MGSRSWGSDDLRLLLNEQNGDDLIQLFDKLDDLTCGRFAKAKAEIDVVLAKNCGINTEEKYQMVKSPPGRNAPDYGSKIHMIVAPVYYHNYMMGELFASQLHHAIAREVYKGADPDT